ncbi:Beta sliding clamp [Paraconexibacter sp. AEG42_29]|uniref:Beta sliding clamp n=1 Tax=Paraconexibacter sp. AEG42_29 TaxID=2997339 RepID=A0AAU7ANH4_9ACTN
MKLSTTSQQLLGQLQTASRVASTRSAVQALSGVQLDAAGTTVELRATDMELALRVPLEATVEREGTVVLPARLLLDVARQLPTGPVSLELRAAEQDVEIIAGPARFHLRTLRAEDFPPLPTPGGDSVVQVPALPLDATIDRVERSASKDETRPILTGVLVSASGTQLRMVATDSYRLSVKETVLEAPLVGELEANVPVRALQELRRLIAGSDDPDVRITVRENQIIFEHGAATLSSRLIDGQFPNYRQLLPDTYEHELHVPGDELAGVVKRISLMAQKNAPLRLSFTEGQLTVSARTPDVGEASEPLPIPFTGEAFEIGFNPEYLKDGLDSVGSDDVVLKLISPLRPGLIESGDGSGFLYLIMPIRLNV